MTDSIAHQLDSIGTQLSSQISEVYNALPDATRIYPAPYGFVDSNVMPVAYHLGLDKWDYTAIIIGVLSFIIACCAWYSQRETERNTKRITEDGQFNLLVDYMFQSYRNLILTKAMYAKLGRRYATHYISQEHFRKLQFDPDALHPEAFVRNNDKYQKIYRLHVMLRNFNLETEVAELHVCNENVGSTVKERDLNTLIFKQNFFCSSFIDCIKALCTQKQFDELLQKTRQRIYEDICARYNYVMSEKQLSVNEKLKIVLARWEANCYKKNRPIDYFTSMEKESNRFAKILFPNDTDMFFQLVNSNIDWEIHIKNSQGFDRIAIIAFQPEYDRDDESNQGA